MAGAFTNSPGKLLLRVVWLRCWRTAALMKVFSSTTVYFHSFTYSLIFVSSTSSYLASCPGYDLQSNEMSSTQTSNFVELGKVGWFSLVL